MVHNSDDRYEGILWITFNACFWFCDAAEQSGDENITQMLKRAHDCRKTAENAAKALLMKLDGSCGGAFAVTGCSVQPWESLSSNSHTRYYRESTAFTVLFHVALLYVHIVQKL